MITLEIQGMSCASCVGKVEKALRGLSGVETATVNLATRKAYVRGSVTTQSLVQVVERLGYQAKPVSVAAASSDGDYARAATWAMFVTIPLVVLEMGGHLWPSFHHGMTRIIGETALAVVALVLSSAVLLGPGRRFFRQGWASLRKGSPDMSALVAMGTLTAWGASTLDLLFPELFPAGTEVRYFEAAAVIVSLVLLGKALEGRALSKAGSAIRALLELTPDTAIVVKAGQESTVPIADLKMGDLVRVRPGERVPVDATVVEGTSYLDESMLTGEAAPVKKQPGSSVVGGTLNGTGSLLLRTTALGSDSVLASIVAAVEEAQGSKLPLQTALDRVTAVFVPAVMLLALLAGGLWWSLGPEPKASYVLAAVVSVLVIACPCAMGLAAPTSVMVATGRAAEMGILVKGSEAWQRLDGVRLVAFDKTGTLTLGRPTLTSAHTTVSDQEEALLHLAASVESPSEHPLSRAFVEEAQQRGLQLLPVTEFEAVVGRGVRAVCEGKAVVLGTQAWMEQLGLPLDNWAERARALEDSGQTPVLMAVEQSVVAVWGVSDPLRPEALQAIQALQARGVKIAVLSGDRQVTTERTTAVLSPQQVRGELSPTDKAQAVLDLRSRYGSVAFVGDGINDAPALASADLGIAVSGGTDVAIASADLVLVGESLGKVPQAIRLGRATMRNIRQNLFWAFAYNAALIPVAAGVLYPFNGTLLTPTLASLAMAFSSLFVVANALRLRSFSASSSVKASP